MRRLILTVALALACVTLTEQAVGQLPISVAPQASVMAGRGPSLNGTLGLGGRVALQPPLLPIDLVGQGVYYFSEGDGSYGNHMSYGLAAKLSFPLAQISPYAVGGWQRRNNKTVRCLVAASPGPCPPGQVVSVHNSWENGATVGVGVELGLGLPIFVEGAMEFGYDNFIVIQSGVLFRGLITGG